MACSRRSRPGQARPLETVYPVVFFDALRGEGSGRQRGAQQSGVSGIGRLPRRLPRDSPGFGSRPRRAPTWMKVFNDLKTRGLNDILIAVTDGLTGIRRRCGGFPRTTLQTCIVHLIRNSLDYASWKDRRRWPRRFAQSMRPPAPRPPWRRWMRRGWRMWSEVPPGGCRLAAGLGPSDPASCRSLDLNRRSGLDRWAKMTGVSLTKPSTRGVKANILGVPCMTQNQKNSSPSACWNRQQLGNVSQACKIMGFCTRSPSL